VLQQDAEKNTTIIIVLPPVAAGLDVAKANELFVFELKKYVPRLEMMELYKMVLSQEFKVQTKKQI
jgi:hypothetical protein